MSGSILLDTDVAIDHLRGHPNAIAFLSSLTAQPLTSVVVVAELYAGVRDGVERAKLVTFLGSLTILPLTESIAIEGGLFRRQYGKSHNVGLPDALIAATAQHAGLQLATLNARHFPMLDDVLVPYAKP
jgi:predicted nucleic acid-binding protein